jgi:hypothetical protein
MSAVIGKNPLRLYEALRELPIEERGEINRSKLGWFLKKNANRIANGLEIQAGVADGRKAWRVVRVSPDDSSSSVGPTAIIASTAPDQVDPATVF